MIKKLLVVLLVCFGICSFTFANELPEYSSLTSTSCPGATATDDANFCGSFKTSAVCHCSVTLPACKFYKMSQIYKLMLSKFGSIKSACDSQHDTDSQTCVDDWNCYLLGGNDSHGNHCSSSGQACPME